MTIFCMVTTRASSKYTIPALESFARSTTLNPDDALLLIDNDASFSLPQGFSLSYLTIEVNPKPLGFAENMNRGIREALTRKTNVVLLNNDLIFSKGWNEQLFNNEQRITSPLSSREVSYQFENFNATNPMSLESYIGNETIFDSIAAHHRDNNTGILNVFTVPFFAVGIPFEIISKVGFLDESFGKGGGEDYDYCLRAILQGALIQYEMSSYVLHFGGKSSWSGAESSNEQSERERLFFARFEEKWGPVLTDIVLRENVSLIEENPQLADLVAQGNYRAIVEMLKS